MVKSLDRKLAAIHADPHGCREFILADAKDADMAFGLGAPGQSPEAHAGELPFRTLAEYREMMRLVTRQSLVDIMLMSVSSNHQLTITERLFDQSSVTPAIRANDTTDVHLARGSSYAQVPAHPFRTASIDHAQCGHLDCSPTERSLGADLGLYSVTFNNDLTRDLETLQRFREFREEAERKKFRYFLEVFDPNMPNAIAPDKLANYINDMIARMLAGVAPAGRPVFLKIAYHGPKAMEDLVRYDPHLVVGILGGSAGTTRDAFQLLYDCQKYGGKAALFGRKINQAENQLAFVQFLRLIIDGVLSPADAVKAYHAVLQKLGIPARRSLDDDLKLTTNEMSYGGTSSSIIVPPSTPVSAPAKAESKDTAAKSCSCGCKGDKSKPAESCSPTQETKPPAVKGLMQLRGWRPLVTESKPIRGLHSKTDGTSSTSTSASGHPDFAKMSSQERLEYHRKRLGFGPLF